MLKHLVSFAVGCSVFLSGCGTAKAYATPATTVEVIESRDAGHTPPSQPFVLEEINAFSIEALIEELDSAVKAGAKSITLKINSPGGSVFAGFELVRKMEELGVPVHCKVDGAVASMAVYVLESCTTRTMTKRSFMMLHGPGAYGEMGGQAHEFANMAEFLRILQAAYVAHIADRVGVDPAVIQAKIDGGREWWLTPQEALAAKLIDAVK